MTAETTSNSASKPQFDQSQKYPNPTRRLFDPIYSIDTIANLDSDHLPRVDENEETAISLFKLERPVWDLVEYILLLSFVAIVTSGPVDYLLTNLQNLVSTKSQTLSGLRICHRYETGNDLLNDIAALAKEKKTTSPE